MKKKLIIAVSALLCLGLGCTAVLYCAPYGSPSKAAGGTIPQPVQSYGLSTSLSGADCYLDRLEELKADGITHLELCLREDYESELALFGPAMEKIKASGLAVWSVHLPFGKSVNPAEPDEAMRTANMEKVQKFVTLTETSGAKVYVIHGSYEPIETAERAARLQASIESIGELNSYMKNKGLRLALEELPRSCIGNSIEDMRAFAQQIPDLGFCFDSNHFTPEKPDYRLRPLQRLIPSLREKMNPTESDPVSYVDEFAGRIVTVHMADYDGVDECHWLPGQGIVDFASIHSSLMAAGFDAPILFEPNEKCKGVRTTGERLISGYEEAIGLQS